MGKADRLASIDVSFGYTGDYTATPHGLVPAILRHLHHGRPRLVGAWHLGAVSHTGDAGLMGLTLVNVDNR